MHPMIRYSLVAIVLFCLTGALHAQSILPPYLLGEWQFVEDGEVVAEHAIGPMQTDTRISPTDQLTFDGVRFYFYEDNQFQKAIYTVSNKELMLGNGKVLSFEDGQLIMEVEELYMNGRLFGMLASMPEMKFDTLNIAEMPPFHFKDILEYPSSKKRGTIMHDTLYYLKVNGLADDSGE